VDGDAAGDDGATVENVVADIVVDPVAVVSSSVFTPDVPEQPATMTLAASNIATAFASSRIPHSPG